MVAPINEERKRRLSAIAAPYSTKRQERAAVFSEAFAGWLESLRRALVKPGV